MDLFVKERVSLIEKNKSKYFKGIRIELINKIQLVKLKTITINFSSMGMSSWLHAA